MTFCISSSQTLILTATLFALGGCGNAIVDDGSGFLKTSSGQLIAWPSESDVRFETDESVPNDLREQIALGQENINDQISRVKISVRLQSSQAPKIRKSTEEVIGDDVNGIYFLAEPWPWAKEKGKENSSAMTVIKNRGTRIVEADIFYRASAFSAKYSTNGQRHNKIGNNTGIESDLALNGISLTTEFNQPTLDRDAKWAKVGFIHECMHALGFSHITGEKDSIMRPVISTSLYENPFSKGDLARLEALY